ncbi:hypothetical protein HO133_004259 [Letharia lupina]|uniref:Uncharacterized protein n=1 Tax=Letharia lupina TaxID=560253 RepID=A0A8H6KZJ1_9LECA|nr:uncharacterized protein HO133_004259 [Letharia lupina]KAF6229922.1 hypothetical protein HO133_004259 [Letharia lupina]
MPFKLTCFVLLVALFRFVLTSSPLSLSSLAISNITLPSKNTPTNPSLSARPHENLEMSSGWDGPGFISITFSHYGDNILPQLAFYCIAVATNDAWIDHRSHWNQAIRQSELVYTNTDTSRHVILSVLPRAAMTWNMFYYSMLLVTRFTRVFDSMAFDFEVEVTGVRGLAAIGNLTILPKLGS